ncbi:Transcription factor bHLH25 [Camellia lanceoleosa]|uniref:Transcription factor bHLH25 n=1 Tax=Camellia lanceoleosa TaxID=1840588 RepID=A0ACC0IUW4_9ERIC|nr:Transcription factor bHLH25 [Camellia lanceoleosa]
MDMSLEKWISELEMEDYNFIEQHQTNSNVFDSVVEFTQLATVPGPGENLQQPSSSESYTSCPTLNPKTNNTNTNTTTSTTTTATTLNGGLSAIEICKSSLGRPTKQIKTNTRNKVTGFAAEQVISPNTSSELDIYLADLGSPPSSPSGNPQQQQLCENVENNLETKDEVVSNKNMNNAPKAGQKRSSSTVITRTPLEAQDRVMAERKRRENLSQRFIALSAIVPGLKKMDKASVLGDAIKYLKHLQERVKLLEEQINKKSEESVVFVKKSQLCAEDDTSSCDENFHGHFKETLPEIEARISEKSVLIRIHCEKQKGFAVKLLSEIERLNLSVVNSSFLPFGQYAMDITVVAQMDDEFRMTVKDLVRNLRSALFEFL